MNLQLWLEWKYILFHPVKGFEDLKERKTGSTFISALIVLLWFFATVIERQYKQFRFNEYNVDNTNVQYIFIATIILFLIWVVSNWSVCTLTDGEGSFNQIWIASGYALSPLVISLIVVTICSYFFSLDDEIFVNAITAFGYIWMFLILFFGMMQIHQYDFGKTLITILFTVVGVIVILFLCFLVLVLFEQLFSFVSSVVEEAVFRVKE